ncbi:antibiotic biosynthesis monooxygenase [Nocardia sp. NPDC050793]|uniref:antibiotic biosynthesis monooxygenase n=1 Tax=Nocardia sp. NPDC050793 TaxID=3155159 RepID=UPI00340CDE9D
MTVGMIALHYPEAGHFEDFVARVRKVAAVMRATPGCLSATYWADDAGDAVISTVEWESDEAVAATYAALGTADVDVAFDARERRPREIIRLRSLA